MFSPLLALLWRIMGWFSLSNRMITKDATSVDDEILDSVVEGKPLGPPPNEFITTELFTHQKEGLKWLIRRENNQELPPFWEEGNGVFTNLLTNCQCTTKPDPLRGGIFADDMGLGKTLTLLSLIATNRPEKDEQVEEEVEEDEECGRKTKGKRRKKGAGVGMGARKKRKTTNVDVHIVSKTTLVVCPPVVLSTWRSQLTQHTKPGSFKVYMYYNERTNDVQELRKYDIVLTTYTTLANEVTWTDSPINKMEWFRIILDEAHLIKNADARQSKAVIALKAKRRWVVTGTLVQNGSHDLFSLMAFLKFEPLSTKKYWVGLVQKPLSQGQEGALSLLEILMATISLRRAKESTLIGLPPKTVETCYVEFFTEERELYDQMEFEVKTLVQSYIHVGNVMHRYSTILSMILRLRQICDDVALFPDIRSLLPSNNIEDASNNPELLKKLVVMLQDGDDLDCPICISPPINTVITLCAHIFCRACILNALRRQNPSCPLCRQSLSESDLFAAPPPESSYGDSGIVSSSKGISSKVSALLKLLVADRENDPCTKSVIFSQFRKMLILLEEALKASGFMILRLDGSMSGKKREKVINEFSKSESGTPTVLLASLRASGAGINLTAASRVYLLEPWWNSAVEEQAMDRVYRIGQTKDVKMVRLIIRDSIEERILALQDKKKELAREALKRRSGKDFRQIGVEDLRFLMAL